VLSLTADTTLLTPPITAEPVSRPAVLPRPPTTSTKNDISTWSSPMNGCTGTSGAISTPARPARHVPATKVAAAKRPTRMPSARARSGLSTIAWMRVPVRLRPYHSSNAPSTTMLIAISSRR